ncbi:MAG: hypothetical protein HY544_02115 [Candidatus Diapherotrites archaeon]|uniref:Uncharacterized protein n=1 Tax=Candidatus Iainarchaeum sp. TaxID=3101447 RepID=A0A8T3YKR1_9ARCH|nr:hypothetical protein [Candidatus Diapherotrites archaeon]
MGLKDLPTWAKFSLIILLLILVSTLVLFLLSKQIENETPLSLSGSVYLNTGAKTGAVVFYDSKGQQVWDWVQGSLAKDAGGNKTFVSIILEYTRPPSETGYYIPDGTIYTANIYNGTCKEKGDIKFFLPKVKRYTPGKGSVTSVNADLFELDGPMSIKLYNSSNFVDDVLVRYANGFVTPIACADL